MELRKAVGNCIIFNLKKTIIMILIFNMGFLLQMPMSQVPQMYGQSVMPTQLPTPPMFVPSQLPVVRFISPIL